MISVVIPTIDGRERLLEQTVQAFEETTAGTPLEFIVPRNHPTCGEAWNEGALKARGKFLLLGADDLMPHHGWLDAARDAALQGVYPAPWIVRRDGSTECCGTLGSGLLLTDDARDGLPACNSPVPFMHTGMWWKRVGPTLPIHCYSDDFLGYKARLVGLRVEVRRGYKFTHLDGQIGHRPLVLRAGQDRETYAKAVSRL